MATLSQIGRGLAMYAEDDLLPKTEEKSMSRLGFGIGIAAMALNPEFVICAYLKKYKSLNDIVTTLFTDESGRVDIDVEMSISILKESLRKNGKNGVTELNVPLVGEIGFKESDIDKLREYILASES